MSEAMAANVLAGLIFFGVVYYVMYIPYRDKKLGIDQPKLIDRIKRDVLALFGK